MRHGIVQIRGGRILLPLIGMTLLAVSAASAGVLDSVGEHGLWRLAFEDGQTLSAADFATNAVTGGAYSLVPASDGERRLWTSPAVDVEIVIRHRDAMTSDLKARVTVRRGTATELAIPARMRFAAKDVKRFVYPGVCLFGPGMAFNAKFYRDRHVIDVKYPTLCADFAMLETTGGESMSIYGLRPRPPHVPWQNPAPFVPGRTATGGDGRGGFFDHAFAIYVCGGNTWESPVTRIAKGRTLETALADYAAENGIVRTLPEKVRDPTLLSRLLRAPLYNINDLTGATMSAARQALATWPKPTLFHFTGYLKGGFDREYPDHLPPPVAFGTPEAFRELIAYAQGQGHVVCPYTNPTWWCDHPRGPTFAKWGEAPLARKKDGTFYREEYAGCDGYVQTYAHPGSLEGNRRTVRQFTTDYPVDLLFQDQCGSRDWIWSFNPVLDSPTLQTEGIISMGEEDSASVPLATEDGWDGLANSYTAFMGCTRRIVPYDVRPSWARLYKEIYPPDTWVLEPILLRLLHGKVLFYQHNLGQFTTDERILAWSLALGYSLSFCSAARDWEADDTVREWYRFLHLLQSSVIARLADKPLTAFRHDRGPLFAAGGDPMRTADDGVVTACFGDVSTAVNLGDRPRVVAGKRLAAYGWDVSAPGLHAYFHDGKPPTVEAEGRTWTFETPSPPPARSRQPSGRAAGARIGILDVAGLSSWGGAAMPDEWREALSRSSLATECRLAIVPVTSASALMEALERPGEYWAIINPYGEAIPVERAGDWGKTIDALRAYVSAGGNWIETGGLSFVAAVRPGEKGPAHEFIGGLRRLGLCSGVFPSVYEPATALRATARGAKMLSAGLRRRLGDASCRVNRPLPESVRYPFEPIVEDAAGRSWFGAYRLDGGGALWRFGMIRPDKTLAISVVEEVLAYRWREGPSQPPPIRVRRVVEQKLSETRKDTQ